MPTVGLLDISGIQDVIFRSNNLQEIASTSEAIEGLSAPDGLFATVAGENLLYTAGGNLTLTGSTDEEVANILKTVQYELLSRYPNLTAVTALAPFEEGHLLQGYQAGMRQLERRKLTAPRSISLHHPGWQEPQSSFADEMSDGVGSDQPLRGHRDLNKIICKVRRGQKSDGLFEKSDLMAVVSVDGLSMGNRIITWMKSAEERSIPDEEFRVGLSNWSLSVRKRWNAAWEAATSAINSKFDSNLWQHPWQARSLQLKQGGRFPYRKIYQGGDDLSFVCDAHVAMAMATHLVGALEQLDVTVPIEFQSLTASVGILYVNNKFPFARANELAGKLQKRAKETSAKETGTRQHPPSSLTWWLNRQGEMEIAEPTFKGATQRPYLLTGKSPSLFDLLNCALPTLWKEFGESRSLLKSIIEAAQAGADGEHVARALKLRSKSSNSTSDNPFASLQEPFNTPTGFADGGLGTILLDAGELYDLYFPLEKGEL